MKIRPLTRISTLADQDEWSSMGAKIQNEFYLTDGHLVTMGIDTAAALWGGPPVSTLSASVSGFIQDRWHVTPRFSVTPGLRYETIRILWNNENFRTGGYANPGTFRRTLLSAIMMT
ncbi:MAG: hypothetical protein R2861_10060 [Desulfobacterales bacterium]